MIPQNGWNFRSGRPRDGSELRIVRGLEHWIAPYLRRAHLPRSPWAPAVQIVIGLLGIGLAGTLLEHEYMDVRPLAFATFVFAAALTVPALGMVLDGVWVLARRPLQHFSPQWYARLVPLPDDVDRPR